MQRSRWAVERAAERPCHCGGCEGCAFCYGSGVRVLPNPEATNRTAWRPTGPRPATNADLPRSVLERLVDWAEKGRGKVSGSDAAATHHVSSKGKAKNKARKGSKRRTKLLERQISAADQSPPSRIGSPNQKFAPAAAPATKSDTPNDRTFEASLTRKSRRVANAEDKCTVVRTAETLGRISAIRAGLIRPSQTVRFREKVVSSLNQTADLGAAYRPHETVHPKTIICKHCQREIQIKDIARHLAKRHKQTVGEVTLRQPQPSTQGSRGQKVSLRNRATGQSRATEALIVSLAQQRDDLDATKNVGFPAREFGKYGSYSLHDDYSDESNP